MADFKVGTNDLVLSNVFRFCDPDTLQQCRLVNRQWLRGAQRQTWIRLETTQWTRRKRDYVEKMLCDNAESENVAAPFRNFGISTHADYILLVRQHHAMNLRSLSLDHLEFDSLEELQDVLYYSFPNMHELHLNRLYIRRNNKDVLGIGTGSSQEKVVNAQPVKSTVLKKLVVNRWDNNDRVLNNVEEAIRKLGLSKLLTSFAHVKDFTYNGGRGHQELDVFEELYSAKVCLKKLTVTGHGGSLRPNSGPKYLKCFGRSLEKFDIYLDANSSMDSFEYFSMENLKTLKIRGNVDMNGFGAGIFKNLTGLDVTKLGAMSLKFVDRMPELQKVRLGFSELVGDQVQDLALPKPCKSVVELDCVCERFTVGIIQDQVFAAFPNIKKLTLSGWLNKKIFAELISKACECCPNLCELYVTEYVGFAGCTEEDCDDPAGNVPRRVLFKMVQCWRELEVVSYQSWGIFFRKRDVEELLTLPKLRNISLRNVAISEDLMTALKQKVKFVTFGSWTKPHKAAKGYFPHANIRI